MGGNLIGLVLGNYKIERQIPDSQVFLTRRVTLSEESYVLKTGDLERIKLEAQILQELTHPNIISVKETELGNTPYIALEYCDKTLREKIPCDWKEAIEYAKQTLAGLAHAHSKGVIHSDIKPENLLLSDGKIKIADWDIATYDRKASKEIMNTLKTYKSVTQIAKGTPAYMSPEQQQGQGTAKTDIYSVGIILYEMLTGKRPTIQYEPASTMAKSPKWIDEVIRQALTPEAEKRPDATKIIQIINKNSQTQKPKQDYGCLTMGIVAGIALMASIAFAKNPELKAYTYRDEGKTRQVYYESQETKDKCADIIELLKPYRESDTRILEIVNEIFKSTPNKITEEEADYMLDYLRHQ